MKSKLCLLLGILIIPLLVVGCSSPTKEIKQYVESYSFHLGNEIDECNNFIDQLNKRDSSSAKSISELRDMINRCTITLSGHLAFFQSPYPTSISEELKDAVNHTTEGTTDLILSLKNMDVALANSDSDQLALAVTKYDNGINKVNEARNIYNKFIDSYNESISGPSIGYGILIGTGVLWGLNMLVVTPIARSVSRRKYVVQPVSGQLIEKEKTKQVSDVDDGTFILVDTIILGMAGLILGLAVGWFFIGLTWKARQWPGLIAFIGLSFLGFYLHG